MSKGYHWHQGGAYIKSSSVNTVVSFHCLYFSMAFLDDAQWPYRMMFSTTRGVQKNDKAISLPLLCRSMSYFFPLSKKKRIKINKEFKKNTIYSNI